jgi:adenylate kinase
VVHRADDTPEAHRDRLRSYSAKTLPLVEYYRGTGILVEIDGNSTVDGVAEEIRKAINGD